jgi:hypothetical protein
MQYSPLILFSLSPSSSLDHVTHCTLVQRLIPDYVVQTMTSFFFSWRKRPEFFPRRPTILYSFCLLQLQESREEPFFHGFFSVRRIGER